ERDGLEEVTVVTLFVVEALAVTAGFVLLAATTGTRGVAGQLLAGHDLLLPAAFLLTPGSTVDLVITLHRPRMKSFSFPLHPRVQPQHLLQVLDGLVTPARSPE